MIGSRHARPERPVVAGARVPASLSGELTRLQVAVTRLVAAGMTDARIAHELGMERGTVSKTIEAARARLDAPNRAALAATAVRRGLI